MPELNRLLPAVATLSDDQKRALCTVSQPALRQYSVSQYDEFLAIFNALIAADGHTDALEFTLSQSIYRDLDGYFHPKQRISLN